ncbi:7771_t:CDS:2 [Funneliformis geosporum]|uniref:439_t:CDS:1 n=1 Tax=Funneliformis geosporum TaxID=1117311 RepID=A0A9W4SQL5_9GLOM|nr:7771_t:CDS:2 [Funneliformis geosporum]CAI2177306.1 439_t:CDS:2 [Funneliformis geosporum]
MGSKRKKKKQSQTINKESNNYEQQSSTDPQQINVESKSILNSSIDKEIQLPPLEELSNTSFKILPIEMSSPNTTSFTSIHYCYFKSHESRSNNSSINILPPDKTLFISNLPIDSTETHIKHLFQECGVIDRIIFNGVVKDDEFLINVINENRNFLLPDSSAHVIFQKSEGLKNALQMTKKKRIWTIKDEEIPSLGLSIGWLRDYRLHRPVQIKLQEEVDEYMVKFEEAELERRKTLEEKLNQPDEDGFITVTRVGRRNVNTDGTITVTAAKADEIKNLKPKNKELTDFYRFQMREVKRNKLIDLRKKFEEDKEKIAKLKASRRFKPY